MYRRNWGCRVHEITLAGLRAIVLENELLRVTVLADKGGDVVEFCHKPRDLDFAWLAPAGLRDPRDIAGGAADDAALFHDQYEGGWQESSRTVAPRARTAAPLSPSTGRSRAFPGRRSSWATPGEVAVRLTVRTRRLPFRLAKTFRLTSGEPALMIEGNCTKSPAWTWTRCGAITSCSARRFCGLERGYGCPGAYGDPPRHRDQSAPAARQAGRPLAGARRRHRPQRRAGARGAE